MAYLFGALSTAKLYDVNRIKDEFVDQLHYIITSMALVVCATCVCFKQFAGRPIECAVGATVEDNDADVSYIAPLSYYQFVPFFLMLQAIAFQLPFHFWKSMATHSGVRVHMLINEATDARNIDLQNRQKTIRTLRRHLEAALRFHRRANRRHLIQYKALTCPLNVNYTSGYVSTVLLITKFLYTVNAFAQFRLLNWFMMPQSSHRYSQRDGVEKTQDIYSLYNYGVLRDMINGTEWEHSGVFPRMTICDFECVLSINVMNEKIFILFWLWYALLVVTSFYSFVYWLIIIGLPCMRRHFIVRHLELADIYFHASGKRALCARHLHARVDIDLDRFTFKYLHLDGVLILRMISLYAGTMMGSDLTASLWHSFEKIDNEQALREVVASIAHGRDEDDDNKSHKLHAPPFNTLTSEQWSQVFDANAKMSTISYAQPRRSGDKAPSFELPASSPTVDGRRKSTDGDSDDDEGSRTPRPKTGMMDMKHDMTMKQQMQQRQSASAAARATSAARTNAVARQAATRSAGGR